MKKVISSVLTVLVVIGAFIIHLLEEPSTPPQQPQLPESSYSEPGAQAGSTELPFSDEPFSLRQVPAYAGDPYVAVHGNVPYFTDEEKTTRVFEDYSELDSLGRCGIAYANICQELMPTEKRGDIHHIKPSGWHSVRYDQVESGSLYNRCHLIGFQLAAENDNKLNLITGTRYLNVQGMLPFENIVADYVKETDNHVLYRVTPVFEGDNLVASGVLMEGWSVEDEGEGVCFCVYAYNVQPEIEIDYATGESWEAPAAGENTSAQKEQKEKYVLNVKSHKFHKPDCAGIKDISGENKKEVRTTRQQLIDQGYEPCGRCKP